MAATSEDPTNLPAFPSVLGVLLVSVTHGALLEIPGSTGSGDDFHAAGATNALNAEAEVARRPPACRGPH